MDGYSIRNVPLEDALKEGENVRVSQTQVYQRGVDTRSGNYIVSDATKRRIIIGVLPDGTFGIAISKPGFDVITDGFV